MLKYYDKNSPIDPKTDKYVKFGKNIGSVASEELKIRRKV